MCLAYSILFFLLGMFAVALFQLQIYFPVWLSVALFSLCTVSLVQQYRKKRLGLLMLVIWLVYALPFVHIPPYIWFDFSTDPSSFWLLAVNPYMIDKTVIELTAMLGAVGGLGILLGVSFVKPLQRPSESPWPTVSAAHHRSLAIPVWLIWVGIGFALTVLSAPKETVFTAVYTESASALDGANFSSAWMISYAILTFSFIDMLLQRNHVSRTIKIWIILSVLLLVVVWYQLLRGDRESLPWVLGLALAYYYWAAIITQPKGFSIPWLKLIYLGTSLLCVSFLIGAVRSSLSGASLSEAAALIGELSESNSSGLANALHGTWSATLLTPLSVAGDHIYGLLDIRWGQTYLDLIMSLIPGFLADAIGYVRPIDGNQGPAWEMRYGIGGTHAVVVPFINFRMLGVFLVPAIWAFFLAYLERRAMQRVSILSISLLVTIVAAAPHWLWYGEKSAINALIIWFILSLLYRVSLGLFRSSSETNARWSVDRHLAVKK